MPRHAPPIQYTPAVKDEVAAIARSRSAEARLVERARIILKCLDGKQLQQVVKELEITVPTVRKWRRRFAQGGLAALHDEARSGKPAKYDASFRDRVLALLEQPPPAGLSHWDGRTVEAPWPSDWTPVFMRCGECCGRKVSICNDSEPGA